MVVVDATGIYYICLMEPQGFSKVGDGLVVVSLAPIGESPTVIGFGISRIEPQGFSKVGNGLVVVSLGVVGESPVVVGCGMSRIKP